MFRHTVVMIMILGLSSCFEKINPSASSEVFKNGTLTIPVHQSVKLSEEYTLAFDRVSEDSRCPVDAVCIWPGNAKIHLSLVGPHSDTRPEYWIPLEFNTSNPVAVDTMGWFFEWSALAPATYANEPIDTNAYQVTINVTRND